METVFLIGCQKLTVIPTQVFVAVNLYDGVFFGCNLKILVIFEVIFSCVGLESAYFSRRFSEENPGNYSGLSFQKTLKSTKFCKTSTLLTQSGWYPRRPWCSRG